jgi:hypothetical protein
LTIERGVAGLIVFVAIRLRAMKGQLERITGLFTESLGQNPALTVLYEPYSLDSGDLPFTLSDAHFFSS